MSFPCKYLFQLSLAQASSYSLPEKQSHLKGLLIGIRLWALVHCVSWPPLCRKPGILAAERQAGGKLAETEDKLETHLSVTEAHQADTPASPDKPHPRNLHMQLSREAEEETLGGTTEQIHRPAPATCPLSE